MSTVTKLTKVPYNDFKRMTTILSSNFDENNAALVTKLDELVEAFDKLESITDGDSGGDNIQITAITAISVATKLQTFLEALVTRLQSVIDGSSGADLIGVTTIVDVAGATVQAVLETIKSQLEAHKISSDHDSRYSRLTELVKSDGVGGTNLIGTPALTGAPATNLKDQLVQLRALITQTALGQIADGSLTNAKLEADIKIGSLTELTTTLKTSVVVAINELKSLIDDIVTDVGDTSALTTTTKTSVVGAINEVNTAVGTKADQSSLNTTNTTITTNKNDTEVLMWMGAI